MTQPPSRTGVSGLMLAAIAGALGAACGGESPRIQAPAKAVQGVVTSNVLRDDYAGSNACEKCHEAIYARWLGSPMHNMTRLAASADIKAPFDGRTFTFKNDRVTLERAGSDRFMRVESERKGTSIYRVTKVIGGRYREDFVGVEVDAVGPSSRVLGNPMDEPVLPVSWLIFDKSLRYKGYSVMNPERANIDRGASWRQTCIFCHNTSPYVATIYDDLLGKSAPTYQGSISDKILPDDRLWKLEVSDPERLGQAVAKEIRFVNGGEERAGTSLPDLLADAISVTRKRFGEQHFVEVGVGCEACHGGSREHVADVSLRPTLVTTSPLFAARPPAHGPHDATKAEWVNRTCSRCHTVLFSKYRYTWEGGDRQKNPGGSTINSGEGRDFQLGACASEMSCTTCHDPHAEDARAALDRLATVAGNTTCTSCHAKLAPPEALAAHTHHAAGGEGSACVGCHMPRKNTGLGYRLTRYHRIGSPTDRERVEQDRPLECALCHVDKSIEALVGAMETWWGKRYDRPALRALYDGDLSANAIARTAEIGKPHEQIAAAAVLGERGEAKALPLLAPILASPYPLARGYAKHAIEHITGAPLAIDLDGDPASIRAEAEAFLARRGHAP